MSSYPDITTIIGYSLFAFSEIIPLLPIPANGILHSLAIGITNSFSNTKPNTDITPSSNSYGNIVQMEALQNSSMIIKGNSDSLKMHNKR